MQDKWKRIGGSDIAAIMGVSPYATAYDVWLRLTGQYEVPDNPVLRRGRLFEPVVRRIAAEDFGLNLSDASEHMAWEVAGVPFRASIDALAVGKNNTVEVVELKTSSPFARHLWGDEAPLHYQMQCQWYMKAVGAPRAHLVALIGLDDVRHYVIEADAGLQKRMEEAAIEFWSRHVVLNLAPEMAGSGLASAHLASKYPENTQAMLPASDKAQALMVKLIEAQAERKHAEEVEESLKNELKALIGDAKGLIGAGVSVTWIKTSDRRVTDWQAVAQAAGASESSIESHTQIKQGSRVFRITNKGE